MNQQEINIHSMLRVGTILHGTYRIESYLSSGGFGNTYVATNIEFNERVAIKEFFMKGVTQRDDNQTIVSVSNSENTNSFIEQREKFKKEARRIRQLHNAHIVAVHDLFEENGTAYYVMDYVDGENLAERLKRTGRPMTESEVNLILPQILDALKAVHEEGFCHLDLKPSNIMLTKGGKVILIDFGSSKQLSNDGSLTTNAPTAFTQTPGFAPRELLERNAKTIGPWTDFYALGATLYVLLTNKKPPLPSDIDDDISVDKHLALPMPSSVSDNMKKLVLWLMQTNRMKRPQSVEELTNKLSSIWAETSKRTDVGENASIKPDNNNYSEETIIESTREVKSQTNKKSESKEEQRLQSSNVQSQTINNEQESVDYSKIIGWGCGIPIGFFIILGLFSIWAINDTTTQSEIEEVADSIAEVTPNSTLSSKEQHENTDTNNSKLTSVEEKVIGLHLFSLQWIESKYYGTCEITKVGDSYKCVAIHESDNKADYLKMEGNVTIVSDRHLKFTGTISRKVHYLYNGKEYNRSGTFDFKAWGSRKYWRGQNMDTPDGYDYIDIYFEKY